MPQNPKRRPSQRRPAGPPGAKPAGKPGARPAGKPMAKPAGKPVAKPAGKPVARPGGARKPTGARPAKPGAQPTAKPAGKPMPKAAPGGGGVPTARVKKGGPAKRPSSGKARVRGGGSSDDLRKSGGKRRPPTVETAPARGGGGRARTFLKPDGMGLATKFMLVVSSTIAVLMLIFGGIVYSVASSAIESQIEDDGVIMASLAAKLAEEYYVLQQVEGYRTGFFDQKKLKDKQDPDFDPAKFRRATKDYQDALGVLETRYNDHLKRLQFFGDDERFDRVLNVSVLARKGDGGFNRKLTSSPVEPYTRGGGEWTHRSGVHIAKGAMGGQPMVLFTMGARDRFHDGNKKLGWVAHVFLNAATINAAENNLLLTILGFLLLVVLAGVGVSFILAGRITSPVKELINDIDLVSQGKLEHRTKARSSDEIGVLARAFNAMTESLLVAREKEVENQARAHELNIATEIQANLLPKKIPRIPGFDIDAFYQPSKEVGGDYYDFMDIDENHLGMIVADVSGKGIPGSMVMTMGRAMIRMEALRNLSPSDTFSKANRMIAADIRRGMFITAIYAILDIPNRTLLVASAGHNPMVIWRKESNAIQLVNPNGIALGFDRGPIFERTIKEQMVKLNSGDRVVMYTDGIPESMNPKHEEFGDKRFYQLCQKVANRNSNQFTNIVVAKVKEHQGSGEQHDDITVLTLAVE